ncbi:hypothetical protein [Chryseobacterium kwangjuense]|uniref:Uncharacterized protein n=1 Tax=Chryseobacterium kwangjuense TaxID=267125 RepID=A0A135W687_9FLAO|nr:hypothetical protein [Chryseobacterium kwangjuense]KXH80434.1 hypothetical protein AU378_18650 [Chryseobacterium kwangjuense]
MLSVDELKRIYLNDKIKEIIPFFKKLTPKKIQKTSVILKKSLNKDWGYNLGFLFILSASTRILDQYRKQSSGYYASSVSFPDQLFESLHNFLRYMMNCRTLIGPKLIRPLQGG